MTVSTETAGISYDGNGITTVFSVPFYFLESSHIRVVLRSSAGVESTKTLTMDYTVAGSGTNPSTATVTCASFTPATGEKLRIVRDPPLTQETDYVENDPFPAETHEKALDKLTMIDQAIASDVSRALKWPETSSASSLLPDPAGNGNRFLANNPSGTAIVFADSGSGSLTNVDYKFASVAAMSGQTGMANNAIGITYGYYTANDGGHGTYRYDSSSTATVNGGTAINAAGGAGRWLLIHSGIACAEQFGIVANGTNYASAITTATGLGLKIVFGKQNGEYCVSGSFNMLGDVDFINGARLKFIAESAITVDGDFRAGTLRVDANSYPVDLWAIYLKSGDHAIDVLHCENIKGDGRGAYATKVNFEGEGKVTRIGNLIGKQITDLINGARTGEEGFCGGLYATGPTNSTVAANCRTINIERGYGENIYTTQSDGVTENTADYDSDFVRAFINEATSAAYLNTAAINVSNIVTRGVQKRSVKISGCGNVVVSNAHGYGTRSGTQMSDIVFVADSRNVNVTGTKGFLKFDNVVKLDGATFDGDYCVSDTQLYSSQANIGTGIYAANLVGLKVDGLLATTDCERLLRYDAVDRSETTGVKYNGTKTGTSPILDIQNCDDLKLSYEVSAAFSGSTGQIVYIQGSNRATIDGIGAATYAGAGGQNIRYNNCTYLTATGYNESNKYNIFDEGTNAHVKFDQWVKQTGTNQPISITATDWLELNCSQLTGDFTGVNMTTGVVALSNIDHFKVTGIYQALNMTDASNDRGIVLTSCTRGTVDVETFTGASDPEMIRLSSCSKVYIKSISDSTKPVRILNTCTDIALQSFGPGAATNDAGAETTVINNVSTW